MLDVLKGGADGAKRRDYRIQLVCERLVGEPQDSEFVNDDMRRGIELEPAAIGAYEELTGNFVELTGFLKHNDLMVGCSLDGHVGDFSRIVEVKCPRPANHLKYLRGSGVPAEHLPQLTHALWVTGAEYADFVSYSPAFPAELQVFYVAMHRSELDIDGYAKKALAFLAEVETELSAIKGWRALQEAV